MENSLGLTATAIACIFGVSYAVSTISRWHRNVAIAREGVINGHRKIHELPSTLPILLNTLDLMKNLPRFHDWNIDYCKLFQGEPFVTQMIGQPNMIVVSTPQAVEDILKNHFGAFPKGAHFNSTVEDLLGHGIFAVDSDKWVHQRKTASRLFTLRALRETMSECIQKHTKTLLHILHQHSRGETIDLFRLFNRLTMEAFAEIGFGIQMNCLDSEEEHPFQTAFDGAQRVLALRFNRPRWFWEAQRWLGMGIEGELKRYIQVIDSTVLNIINESLQRRASDLSSAKQGGDIVSLFLDTIGTDPMGDDSTSDFDSMYLRDIVVNFIIAGRDTTAQALSWFLYSVSQHPEVERKIIEEVREKLPSLLENGEPPSMEEVGELMYLDAALHETLRLYPSVPFVNKKAAKDVVLSDGTFIPKDAIVGIAMLAMGRMKYVWGDDAADFKPERWINPITGRIKTEPASKFIAFNAGPRTCLGMSLALLELKLVAASVLSRFHISLVNPEHVTYAFSLTLPMKDGLVVTVSPRKIEAACA